MSHCCENHKGKIKAEKISKKSHEERPKSFIGKYLYELGKKDMEKGVARKGSRQ